jgi:putative two-component system response regulator
MLEAVSDAVLQHREPPDGRGYPHGLRRDASGLEARVVAVADVVEAQSSHRP